MAEKRVVYVFLPAGSREEVTEVRRALDREDVQLVMCSSLSHTQGQKIPGDVVVIGSPPAGIEEDAAGDIHKVRDLAGLQGLGRSLDRRARAQDKAAEEAGAPGAEPQPEAPAPASAPADAEPKPESDGGARPTAGRALPSERDKVGDMDRVERIQYAARKWPGARRWATMTDEDLLAAIKEMEASD